MHRKDEDMFEADTETPRQRYNKKRMLDITSLVRYVRYVAEPALMFLAGREGRTVDEALLHNLVQHSQNFTTLSVSV